MTQQYPIYTYNKKYNWYQKYFSNYEWFGIKPVNDRGDYEFTMISYRPMTAGPIEYEDVKFITEQEFNEVLVEFLGKKISLIQSILT